MKPDQKQKRNRLIALSFASVLLVLIYGPLAQWFVAADRVIYDQLAAHLPQRPLENAYIVSFDPAEQAPEDLVDSYGDVVAVLIGSSSAADSGELRAELTALRTLLPPSVELASRTFGPNICRFVLALPSPLSQTLTSLLPSGTR